MLNRHLGLVIGYSVSLAGGVLSLSLYAHLLGAREYGRLAVDLALIEALQSVIFQWHRLAAVRFWASNEGAHLASYLVTYHLSWLGLAGASIAVLGVVQLMDGQSLDGTWLAVLAMGVAKSAALYTQELARAAGAGLRYAIGALCLTVGGSIAGCVAYEFTHSITDILIASTLVFIASSLVCGWPVAVSSLCGRFQPQHLSEMLRYGLPLVPVFVAITALTRLDRPILAQFEAPTVVGVYAAANALVSSMTYAACMLVVTPAYPWLLREKESRKAHDFMALQARVGVLMMGGVLATAIAVYSARYVVLPLMLGTEIGNAAQAYLIPLFAIAIVGAFRAHFFDQAYHLFAKTRVLMLINLVTLGIAVTALYVGARSGGLKGLLCGLLLANTLSLGMGAAFARSFVAWKQLSMGVGLLILVSIAACLVSRFAIWAWSPATPGDQFAGIASAAAAMVVFACGMYSTNVGSIRALVSGRLS